MMFHIAELFPANLDPVGGETDHHPLQTNRRLEWI